MSMFLQYYVSTAACWTDFMVLVCQNWGFFFYFSFGFLPRNAL